jgi:GxxExxY protein
MLIFEEPSEFYNSASSFLRKEDTYKIIGACMEVHKQLGKGFLEIVYKDALEIEFNLQGIPFKREHKFEITNKGNKLNRVYVTDFVVFDSIILEIKAQEFVIDENYKQVINYLAVSKQKLGLIINFGEDSLKFKRVAL